MASISFTINGRTHSFEGDADMPLLWHLRDEAGLKGTKFGCGIGQCGACTVHIDGMAVRSCSLPMSALDGVNVTTIEGLSNDGEMHPVQEAWLEEDVPQCGYCQAGQIMATVAFLKDFPDPSDDDINKSVTNLCRCGTYFRIRKAIKRAAAKMQNA
ncbi:(2Fe-2S)-binding protein [Kordiimonas sp.]|uniref:(2Fe-2S)-binding protein n=1 Tax=Kordiimonas sp. TaxID=1970157 RepID=UPI003A8DB4E3